MHLNLFSFRFRLMTNPVRICTNKDKKRRSNNAVVLSLVLWKGTEPGKRFKKVQTKGSRRFRCNQKGSNRFKDATNRFKQVHQGSGSGAPPV